jgi:uncharacterized protein GlcG (DUF336 family)
MYKKEVLGLDQAWAAVTAALAEAKKEPKRPVAIAVVDERGDLIAYAAMDGSYPLYKYMAIHKAYTAARMQRDTAQFDEWLRETDRDMATWGDSKYTRMHGGLCIVKPDGGYLLIKSQMLLLSLLDQPAPLNAYIKPQQGLR